MCHKATESKNCPMGERKFPKQTTKALENQSEQVAGNCQVLAKISNQLMAHVKEKKNSTINNSQKDSAHQLICAWWIIQPHLLKRLQLTENTPRWWCGDREESGHPKILLCISWTQWLKAERWWREQGRRWEQKEFLPSLRASSNWWQGTFPHLLSFTIMMCWQWPWDWMGSFPTSSTRPLLRRMKRRQLASLIQTLCLCNFRKSSALPKQSFTSAYYKQVCFFFFLRAQHFSKRGFQPEMGSQNLFSGVTSSGQPCVYSQ